MVVKTFTIKDDERTEIPVWFLGDVHYGHKDCDVELLKKYIEWARKKKAYTLIMGDLIENSMPTHLPHTVWSQTKLPHQQMNEMLEMLKPIKDRIICYVRGNHEKRTWRLTGFDIAKDMAEKLGCYYLGVGGFIRIKTKNQTYNICLHHGYGGSQNPRYHIQKALQVWRGMDVLAIGHMHQLYAERLGYYTPDGKERIVAMRTGGFLDYPDYAMERFYPVAELGAPFIYLNTKYHKFRIEPYGLNGF